MPDPWTKIMIAYEQRFGLPDLPGGLELIDAEDLMGRLLICLALDKPLDWRDVGRVPKHEA